VSERSFGGDPVRVVAGAGQELACHLRPDAEKGEQLRRHLPNQLGDLVIGFGDLLAQQLMPASEATQRGLGGMVGVAELLSRTWVEAFGRGNFDDAMLARPAAEEIACSEIGDERYSAGLDAGRSCDPQQAVDEARMLAQELAKRCAAPLPSGLTGREVEVLRWVAYGLSNADIAENLAVSPRTIDAHLRSIFEKLDVKTRTAAAHEATRLGAIRPN
jgi:DNA-binding CsgD family transcriptional regulator